MSSCVMSHSPSTLHNDNAHLGSLQEEPFDLSFPFLDPVGGMQYFASATSTPAPPAAEEATLTPRVIPPNNMQHEGDRPESQESGMQDQRQPDNVNMSWPSSTADVTARPFQYPPYAPNTTTHMEGLTLHSTSPIGDSNRPFDYSSYSTSYHFGTPVRPTFHPYRSYGDSGMRSPRMQAKSGPEPLSPPLSTSPPGSSGSHHHALHNTSPTAVSPALVSPASAMESSNSDFSPLSIGWTNAPLPQHPPGSSHLPFSGASMASVAQPQQPPHGGAQLMMVAGFPYTTSPPTRQTHATDTPARTTRLRSTRATVASRLKQEDNDDDSDDLDDRPGLGLSPEASTSRIPVGGRREDVRRARIESEQPYIYTPRDKKNAAQSKKSRAEECQRRRDELREGFRRLKEALPDSNQRPSKSTLLDRAVAHIEQIESANRYLLNQLDLATREAAQSRATYQELAHAVAINTRSASGGSSPHDAARA